MRRHEAQDGEKTMSSNGNNKKQREDSMWITCILWQIVYGSVSGHSYSWTYRKQLTSNYFDFVRTSGILFVFLCVRFFRIVSPPTLSPSHCISLCLMAVCVRIGMTLCMCEQFTNCATFSDRIHKRTSPFLFFFMFIRRTDARFVPKFAPNKIGESEWSSQSSINLMKYFYPFDRTYNLQLILMLVLLLLPLLFLLLFLLLSTSPFCDCCWNCWIVCFYVLPAADTKFPLSMGLTFYM